MIAVALLPITRLPTSSPKSITFKLKRFLFDALFLTFITEQHSQTFFIGFVCIRELMFDL